MCIKSGASADAGTDAMIHVLIDSKEHNPVSHAAPIRDRRRPAGFRRTGRALLVAMRIAFCRSLRSCSAAGAAAARAPAQPRHAIAMHGEPALAEGFSAFRYVNPDAPKGGRLVRGVLGTFDSLNPFIVKGLAPPELRGYVFESLMVRGYDEPFTLYGLLARSVETNDERTYVTFDLDPKAAFADGAPVTAADVIFSWQLLQGSRPSELSHLLRQGRPCHRDVRAHRADSTSPAPATASCRSSSA